MDTGLLAARRTRARRFNYPVQITKHIITKYIRLPASKYAPTQ